MGAVTLGQKISIIVPNYNHGQYIGQSIQSVLDQTYTNFELIVIDDGSTDKSWNVIQSCAAKDERVIAERFPQNRGVAAALERCLQLCHGEYLFPRAADDYLTDNTFLQRAVEALAQHSGAAGAFGGCAILDGTKDQQLAVMGYRHQVLKAKGYYTFLSPEQAQKQFLSHRLFVPGASSIWRRNLIDRHGGYDDSLGPQSDYFINHLLPMLYGVVEIHSLVAGVRALPESFSSYVDDDSFFLRHAMVEKKLRMLLPSAQPETGWKSWRKALINSRTINPLIAKLKNAGLSHHFFERLVRSFGRKYLGLVMRFPASEGTLWHDIRRKHRQAEALFDRIVRQQDVV